MAYKIVYGPEKGKPRSGKKWAVIGAVAVLGLALLGRYLGWGDYLIPGDAAVTAMAAEEMVSQIAAGEPVREAFTDFCREIMDHGEIY